METREVRGHIVDENWEEWKHGDRFIWEYLDNGDTDEILEAEHVSQGYVWFTGRDGCTRETNLLRIHD